MNIILENTVKSDNVQVSISQAKVSDNVQSFILFIAVSGLGTFVGNKLRKKKYINVKVFDEYDN